MGLLKVGKPLTWEESAPKRNYVRKHGVVQFVNTFNKIKHVCHDELLWGDEVEYGIFKMDHAAKTAKLSLRGAEVRAELSTKEERSLHRCEGCMWHPEYGSWMVESTPRQPFSGYAADLLRVERNMRLRRKRLLSVLKPDEIAPTVSCFPLMGVGQFTYPPHKTGGPFSESEYVPDAVINPHPRFGALTRNIRARRGSKVDVRPPLFRDTHTPEFGHQQQQKQQTQQGGDGAGGSNVKADSSILDVDKIDIQEKSGLEAEATGDGNTAGAGAGAGAGEPTVESVENGEPPSVHMDCMAFGMGCCCLQVTFQARDLEESRFMYDQLAVLSPIMLALTAATPILKGRLVDTDVRWATIAASVDDRTPAEKGEGEGEGEGEGDPNMAGGGKRRLYKSRYESISSYLHFCHRKPDNPMHVLDTYNDIACPIDEASHKFLLDSGVDGAMANHVAHLFVRDPLVVFEGAVEEVDDETSTEHWESIQSTNWQTVRWKPPPPREQHSPHIGWRAEFRSMEMMLTDTENAAFTVFVVLATRVILAFDLNLYMPLSMVDENMARAHKRDAVTTQKFWWRLHMAPPEECCDEEREEESKSTSSASSASSSSGSESGGEEPVGDTAVADGDDGDEEHQGHDDHVYEQERHNTRCQQAPPSGFEEMTLGEILTGRGKGGSYPGLIPLIYAYLDHIGCDTETSARVHQYLELIRKRASGELPTTARWMRDFVQQHPDYKHDSHVSEATAHDLLMECKAIGEGTKHCPELLGDLLIRPIVPEAGYDVKLTSGRVSGRRRRTLLQKYTARQAFQEHPLGEATEEQDRRESFSRTREPSNMWY